MKRKKILFLLGSLEGGGAEKMLVEMLNAELASLYDITVMTIYDKGKYKYALDPNITYQSLTSEKGNKWDTVKAAFLGKCPHTRWIHQRFIGAGYDIEIAFLEGIPAKIIAGADKANTKTIAWVHTDVRKFPNSIQCLGGKHKAKKIYETFDNIYCVSYAAKEALCEALQLPKERIQVQYPQINTQKIKEAANAPLPKWQKETPNKFRIVAVGRLEEEKAFERLIAAAEQLYHRYEFEIHILGEGSKRADLEKEIAKKNLGHCVFLRGFLDNPYPVIKSADVFVLCSKAEGFSLALCEAKLLGVACIATKSGGPEEILGQGAGGMLVENSTKGVKEGLETVLQEKRNQEKRTLRPPLYVMRTDLPQFAEYTKEIKDLWESRQITNMGAKHNQLERALKAYLQTPCLSLTANGHMALEMILQAMNLSGEVITTPFTFASTTHAIVRNALTPVFCDINTRDYTIDVTKIEGLITERTTAIAAVHVYGNICQVEKIEQIAKKHQLKVIYDAAHAFGETYAGRSVASFGDASMFSFHATKIFHTIEGGAVSLQDPAIEKMLCQLKNFGIKDSEHVDQIGTNAKMNEFQAAMGLCNLRRIEQTKRQRKAVCETYRELLANIEGLHLSVPQKEVSSNYAYFPILIDESKFGKSRDWLTKHLEEKNIFVRKYFYPLTNTYACYKERYACHKTPNAARIAEQVLTLPLYAELSLEDVRYVCKEIVAASNVCG